MAKSDKDEEFDSPNWVFSDLTRNQKLAIINFLSVIAASDANVKISDVEFAFISYYYKEFGIAGDQYLAYLSIGGRERTITEIKNLSKENMQELVYATTEMCNCTGELNEDEFLAILNWLEPIGMTIKEWNDILENPDSY